MDERELLQNLGLAAALGLLVGLQRERSQPGAAGIRTFPLITVLGYLAAVCGQAAGPWVVGVALGALGVLVGLAYYAGIRKNPPDFGLTSEMAVLLMFLVGAVLAQGLTTVATVTSAGVAVLLHLKPFLHGAVGKLGDRDFTAIMQFVVIALVILPLVPNRYLGPYQVLNPYKIWLMVVLIVGLSLTGYIALKFLGPRAGAVAGGILGGLISSTATTVSYARQCRRNPALAGLATLVIMLASTVVFVRVLILMRATAPALFEAALPPVGAVLLVMTALCAWLWRQGHTRHEPADTPGNPSELKAALFFAAIFCVVLVAAAFARERLGSRGLYAVSILSGLTDMDAITLSLGQMVRRDEVGPGAGWRLALSAALSNLVFKGAVAASLGGRALLRALTAPFAVTAAALLAVIIAWPSAPAPAPAQAHKSLVAPPGRSESLADERTGPVARVVPPAENPQ